LSDIFDKTVLPPGGVLQKHTGFQPSNVLAMTFKDFLAASVATSGAQRFLSQYFLWPSCHWTLPSNVLPTLYLTRRQEMS
jgi:hypothetical protein